jgi:hypothetical protein
MSRPFKASSLSLALLLSACPGDDGGASTTDDAATTSGAAASTGGTSTGAGPVTTGDGTTGDITTGADTTAAETTSPGSTGDDTTGSNACDASVLTWENFGEPFMLTWCTGCHHSALPTAQRAGAPCAANFDTHAGVHERAPVIALRAIDYMTLEGVAPMPPAALVPEEELALLREYLDCGAPGPEPDAAGPACPDP